MRKFFASRAAKGSTAVSVVAATVAVLAVVAFPGLSAGQTSTAGEADFMILNNQAPLAGSNVGYCGVGKGAEPWTLNVAASNGGGTLTIQFRDGDLVSFVIPAGDTISLTESFGGVPTVDDLVRISLSGDGVSAPDGVVSALARPNATDPFIEPGLPESDNLCVNIEDEGPVSTTLAVPDSWVTDGTGSDGGILQ